MTYPPFLLFLKESFSAKLFSLFALVISVISFSFTIFFVIHERSSYTEQLLNEGKLLANLLAYNSRLAVFAENREALQSTAEGITKNEKVKSAAIYSADGELLAEVIKDGKATEGHTHYASVTGKRPDKPFSPTSRDISETGDDISFSMPIMSEVLYPTTESLFFKQKEKKPEFKSIGLVRIVLDKKDLKKRTRDLFMVGAIFLAVFILLGMIVAYRLLKGVTKPLNRLMEGVRNVGRGDLSMRVPVETGDEIGKLATAFNNMAETLERRDEEKSRLEEQLRLAQKKEAEEVWERTFNTVPDLICILDREQRIIQVNEAIVKRFNISREEAVGKKCHDIFHRRDTSVESCPYRNMISNGKTNEAEFYDPVLDCHFWITLTPLRKSTGEVLGCVHVARDITERKRAEEEKRNIQAKLIQTNKMTSLGLMVSGMAHEVNNPNNSIKFSAHLLSRSWGDLLPVLDQYYREEGDFIVGGQQYSQMRESFPNLISGISESSRRIEGIIKNLRDFVHKGKADLSGQVDINKIVSVAASILNNQIKTHTNNFRLELGSDLPVVRGNSQQLEQVIINLIMNALQALPDRDLPVVVRTMRDRQSGEAVIRVIDSGAGMPAEVRGRLFEPFFSTKLESGGTGLGLAISNVIVKDHRGTLQFEPDQGQGTVATVRLPSLQI